MEIIKIEFPIKGVTNITEEVAIQGMMKGLAKLKDFGALKGNIDEILIDYQINTPAGYAVANIDKDALVDASKLNSVGASLAFPVEVTTDQVELVDRQFSAGSINERLRITGMGPKIKFRYMLLDYSRYWRSKKNNLTENQDLSRRLKDLFVNDVMGIFTEILPFIQEGKQLSQLTGLTNITKGMNKTSRDLSLAYKKALRQAKTGQLSKNVLQGLQVKYTEFMNILIPQVFPGIEEVLSQTKTQSDTGLTTYSTLKAEGNCVDKLSSMISDIKDRLEKGEAVTIQVDSGGPIGSEETEYVFTKLDSIKSVESTTVSTGQYSYDESGRINLFD